ncbi:MAG: TetR family transcriptional regulator [Alphaproteobacteria bacterium]|nr:TetR family transcriptional regulator [Alphaproteobacteria bacterium]MDX5368143.1 TetR family transcriptional regulator [Alphaproteobacteria bacterium]MDX5462974.1 TetR family transcriptional regulator [Alphaproteobacteria bacterium]
MDSHADAIDGRVPDAGGGGLTGSKEGLLAAAREAFARRGYEGARVAEIAARAGVNKQLVYHYFGSKEALYKAVLADVYREIRREEQGLHLANLPAEEAMRRLVEFSFDYLARHRDFVAILADANTHGGRHIENAGGLAAANRPIIDLLQETLERGAAEGVFRRGLDAFHVYLSIAGMAFFYFANNHTLSRGFGRELGSKGAADERRAHIVDFALNALRAR